MRRKREAQAARVVQEDFFRTAQAAGSGEGIQIAPERTPTPPAMLCCAWREKPPPFLPSFPFLLLFTLLSSSRLAPQAGRAPLPAQHHQQRPADKGVEAPAAHRSRQAPCRRAARRGRSLAVRGMTRGEGCAWGRRAEPPGTTTRPTAGSGQRLREPAGAGSSGAELASVVAVATSPRQLFAGNPLPNSRSHPLGPFPFLHRDRQARRAAGGTRWGSGTCPQGVQAAAQAAAPFPCPVCWGKPQAGPQHLLPAQTAPSALAAAPLARQGALSAHMLTVALRRRG